MVHIKNISVEGFKSHQSLELPCKNINIITGKNNVGKTSVLEAIDLCFNPNNIRRYGSNADKIINFDQQQLTISCIADRIGGTQTLNQGVEYKININRTDKKQRHQLLSDLLTSQASRFEEIESQKNITKSELDLKEHFRRCIQFVIDEELSENNLDKYIDSCIIIEQNGEQVPFLYLSDSFQNLVDIIAEHFTERVRNELEMEIDHSNLLWQVEDQLRGLVRGRYGRGNLMGKLEDETGVRFIDSLDITKKDVESRNNHSVVLSHIEDDLREKYHVDNLKDFSLDNLVFENEDGRYQIPYSFMGDGFKSVVGLLWELKTANEESQVLLIEEPENHLHPGYINTLVNALARASRDENIQLFITTHNLDFIREFIESVNPILEDYLKEELQIIQMYEYTSQIMNIVEAEKQLNQLHLDLRGE